MRLRCAWHGTRSPLVTLVFDGNNNTERVAVGLPISRMGCGVLVPHQRALLDKVFQGAVVAIRADVAHVQPGIVGGPGRVHLGPLLAAGLGRVDRPKQL
jgi:hypothetical protein